MMSQSNLNPEQLAAVEHVNGPLLVLAGAGSGKTRVITRRIARLLEKGVPAWSILAVTFTNKAAGEMLSRVRSEVGAQADALWVSTFHSAGMRILRREGYKIGLPRSFTIYGDADQLALMKRVLADLGNDGKMIEAKDALARVDQWKNMGVLPHEAKARDDEFIGGLMVSVYRRYSEALIAQGALDFGDLLLRVVQLFRESPDTRDYYRRRFAYLLVDEFQDTNPVQYELLTLLCPEDRQQANLCVVGDDDQSIYRWRGAEVENILRFPTDFPGAKVVKLERNYRSTSRILEAAHGVISKNRKRAEKKLWTEGEPGERIRLTVARDDREEATRIAEDIQVEQVKGTKYGDMAVFYRANAQSRLLEEALRRHSVPYAIFRGRSFYDRTEIRDVASYLRLVVNPKSDQDFLRAVANPPRGIGETSLSRLQRFASARSLTLWDAIPVLDDSSEIRPATRKKLLAFRKQIAGIAERAREASAGAVVATVAEESGLLERLLVDPRGEGEERRENVLELVRAAQEFDPLWEAVAAESAKGPEDEPDPLLVEEGMAGPVAALRAFRGDPDEELPSAVEAFLAQIAMLGDADTSADPDRVSLMTLHAAKGLEYDLVFLSGMEEGVFPHSRSLGEEAAIEEERRLCYVGITRARKKLHLSLASSRALFGDLRFNPPSRFLYEIPEELLDGAALLPDPNGGSRSPSAYGRSPLSNGQASRENRGSREYLLREEGEDWDEFDQRDPYSQPSSVSTRPSYSLGPRAGRSGAGTQFSGRNQGRGTSASPSGRASGASTTSASPSSGSAKVGDGTRVRHKLFGEGRVLSSRGSGPDAKLTVVFPEVGPKVVMARFLEILG